MVLAKKKLKLQLRSLLGASVEAAESGKPSKDPTTRAEDVNQRLQYLRELLISKNRRDNRPTRRGGKKKEKKPLAEPEPVADGGEMAAEVGNVAGCPVGSNEGKKKRKRGVDGAAESSEQVKQITTVKRREKDKKKKKKKKKKMKKMKDNKNQKNEKAQSDEKNAKGDDGTKTAETAIVTDAREQDGDAGKKVYVGGIPFYSTEDDIRSFFDGCGTVSEIDCMTFPESGKFRGIAILTFKTEAAAKRALALDGSDMGGLFLKIKPFVAAQKQQRTNFSPDIIDGYNRIYAGNLAWEITEEDLRKFFQGCRIAAIRFGEDKTTGEFKGYAHVDFHDGASVAAALKLDQAEVCGRPAMIRCAVPKKGRPAAEVKSPAPSGGAEKKKKKRQTCYECGVPGHLSSECPQKKPSQSS